ncbi:ribonuclease H family protein [Hippea maritima]|uniref:ribonuclease H n=1 Tax=Hippea maritima (strain ATCC 700847 / DSM 10411 / MH2) TaxID=760142 RepID=F2LY41_HIPMA|nr:ribonuclease H [Hippea maritima]AEA34364.1 ribonuclease H [Hippea maritima DSM 10411]
MIVEVYTDGSCFEKHSIGGWGVYIIFNKKEIKFSGFAECSSSTSMELIAALKALEYLHQYSDEIEEIEFYIDCDYTAKLMKELKSKDKISFRSKTSFRNRKTLMLLAHYAAMFKINWHTVKSHRGIKGNEIADSLAKKAAKLGIERKRGG